VLSWSGGKDSAFAWLGHAGEVDALLTTYVESSGNLPHVDVPMSLVRAQAELLDLPLVEVAIPDPWSADVYEARMGTALRASSAEVVVFGDLYLDELRRSREEKLETAGLRGTFPCWTEDSAERALEIIDAGIEAVVVSVDVRRLPAELLGRRFDRDLLAELPAEVDRCGERGEFQTFVTGLPGARAPLDHRLGPVRRAGCFATLALEQASSSGGEVDVGQLAVDLHDRGSGR
jgi:uncharacterized protein (TIGR00290 family)